MNIMGVSAGYHDAGVSVIDDNGNILFAAHSERYSRVKNDKSLNPDIIDSALSYGPVKKIGWFERIFLKKLRQLYSGEYKEIFRLDTFPSSMIAPNWPGDVPRPAIKTFLHHKSHAAAGFQTSPFNKALVLILDAIGEWNTASVWAASYDSDGNAVYKKLESQSYPNSIGLFYSAMTQRINLIPNMEEYILMGMSSFGRPLFTKSMFNDFVRPEHSKTIFPQWKYNFHTGVDKSYLKNIWEIDIAASTQMLVSRIIRSIVSKIRNKYPEYDNLVYMGGVALNCQINTELTKIFDNIWIMPNPGDCGSSLGAAALLYRKKLNWKTPYLGHNIDREYPVKDILDVLLTNNPVGVATGRAEFGPRSLGNRSLFCDPRGENSKNSMNIIKRRQQYRPFAPVIMEEFANQYFEMGKLSSSPYMQYVFKCKNPAQFPGIVHVDRTSRVQTVNREQNPGLYELLNEWYKKTGCPMLLNTSLNIRGYPIVNTIEDANYFTKKYGIPVCM